MTVHISLCGGLSTDPALRVRRLHVDGVGKRGNDGRDRLVELVGELRHLVTQELARRLGAEDPRAVGALAFVDQHGEDLEIAAASALPETRDALADGADEAVAGSVEYLVRGHVVAACERAMRGEHALGVLSSWADLALLVALVH